MKRLFSAIVLAGILSGCNQHYFYAPNTLHIPSVREKGDITVEASINGSNQIKGVEAKAAWAPRQNWSVMANYMYLSGSFERSFFFTSPAPPPEQHTGSGFLTELGVTKHFPLNSYTNFAISAGAGLGRSVNDYDLGRVATLNFNRLYLQPSIMSTGKLADFGIGLRFSRLGFYRGIIDFRIDEADRESIQRLEASTPFWIPDLGLSAGVNFSPIRIRCNMTISMTEKLSDYSFSGNNLSVSAIADIHKMLPDKKSGKKAGKKTKKKSSKKKKRRK